MSIVTGWPQVGWPYAPPPSVYNNRIRLIRQGESLPFVFNLYGENTSGWICTINVRTYPKEVIILTRQISQEDTTSLYWHGFLTSTETSALDPGIYRLTGTMTNSQEDEEIQQTIRFQVSQSWG